SYPTSAMARPTAGESPISAKVGVVGSCSPDGSAVSVAAVEVAGSTSSPGAAVWAALLLFMRSHMLRRRAPRTRHDGAGHSPVVVGVRRACVSRATSHGTTAASRGPPETENPAVYPNRSTTTPTRTGPRIAPESLAIWNEASTLPPAMSGPITSATAACCAGLSTPAPTPAATEAATRRGTVSHHPSRAVADPETSRPPIARGRRPYLSESHPAAETTDAVPTANEARAVPATPGPASKLAAANSGTIATRTPNEV